MTFENKENQPPMLRKDTKPRADLRDCRDIKDFKTKHNNSKVLQPCSSGMVIRSCDNSLAVFYMMKEKVMKIGRSPANVIRSL